MNNWFSTSSTVSKCIFCAIILYLIATTVAALAAAGIMPNSSGSAVHENSYVLICFSLVSFALTGVISAFHLSTLIRRRKRKSDKIAGEMREKQE
ncbi:MAG: hypothetical protein Pg6C_17490 [Treponemataceae bacterium]|nr:MAG: hypothetical protein Pg6C_17490 [Treponemataceae bacterium]